MRPDEARRAAALVESQQAMAAAFHKALADGRFDLTPAGPWLSRDRGAALCAAVDGLLRRYLESPWISGRFYAAIPALMWIRSGPKRISAIALKVTLRNMKPQQHKELAVAMGKAVEDEIRAHAITEEDRDALRWLKHIAMRRDTVSKEALAAVTAARQAWTKQDHRQVGGLLLDLVATSTGLVVVSQTMQRQPFDLLVRPSADAVAIARALGPRRGKSRWFPCMEPPLPVLEQGELWQVVRRRSGRVDYLTADLIKQQIGILDWMGAQPIRLDPTVTGWIAEAWHQGVEGLFPVRPEAEPAPVMPAIRNQKTLLRWRFELVEWSNEVRRTRGRRLYTGRSIKECEELRPGPVWFGYQMDFRGRIYTNNRVLTNQGPDHEKAMVSFHQAGPVGPDGREWILRAAAAHHGEKGSQLERLAWGLQHQEQLEVIGVDPLGAGLPGVRAAKDPWQFIQACRSVATEMGGGAVSGLPIRLDQTCSGMGILAALMRDQQLATATNMIGSSREDLYQQVVERVLDMLEGECDMGAPWQRKRAEALLKGGLIRRDTLKGPTMAAAYGMTRQGLVDGWVRILMADAQQRELVTHWPLVRDVLKPARQLAALTRLALGDEIGAGLKLKDWLEKTTRAVIKAGGLMQWTSPSGMPVRLEGNYDPREKGVSLLHGKSRWLRAPEHDRGKEPSAVEACRSATANLIHSFDAALVHRVAARCQARGVPLLTNHDQFVTIPGHAAWLHQALLDETREMYQQDWLEIIRNELLKRNPWVEIPPLPEQGRLYVGQIGENEHLFS